MLEVEAAGIAVLKGQVIPADADNFTNHFEVLQNDPNHSFKKKKKRLPESDSSGPPHLCW